MAETITPVVHGGRAKWLMALALHVLGAGLTAAAFGAALGWIGRLLGAPWGPVGLIVVALAAGLFGLSELLPSFFVPVPQLRRQVPDWWRTFFGPWATAFLYGAGLGIGFFTFLSHGTLVVVATAAVVIGRPEIGALVVGAFGVTRGLTAVVGSRVDSPEEGRALVDRLAVRSDRTRRAANGAALVAVCALAAVAAPDATGGGWGRFASAALALAFGWAAVSKATAPRRWRRSLTGHRLPARMRRALGWIVPVAEGGVPALVLLGMPRLGALWALALLIVFGVEIVRLRVIVGPRITCGCLGGRTEADAALLLVRNAVFAGVAGVAIVADDVADGVRWPRAPTGDDLLPMMLATIGIVAAASAAWRSGVWLARGARA